MEAIMDWKQAYQRWLDADYLEENIRKELLSIKDDETAIEDRFYQNLTFGTGGMRGEMGAGTNRMNRYTIRKATEGLARYIASFGSEAKSQGVVIAFDSRHYSSDFAVEAAKTLGAHDIRSYVFDALRPTPELSFAVRYLNAFSGIMITASHNPPVYNGYKVYGEDGGQLPPETAGQVIDYVDRVEDELNITVADEEQLRADKTLQTIGRAVDRAYIAKLETIAQQPDLIENMAGDLQIVYTPLHGTGHQLVREGLATLGFQNVHVVAEQADPDPEFSTVKSPNPEEHAAFEWAIQYGKNHHADILLATDPDADRVGLAVKNTEGEYTVLNGNQTGALLLHYLLSQKQKQGYLPQNGVVLKTIVTSELGRRIAEDFGVTTVDTLTGFKFIGEKIKTYKQTHEHTFLFGYEESYGYLIGDFVRDKDAVQVCLLAAEVAAWYKSEGKSLYDGLQQIYETYGYYQEDLASLTLKGIDGTEKIQNIMKMFRNQPPTKLAGDAVTVLEDYDVGERYDMQTGDRQAIRLPKANVVKFHLQNDAWFCLRPSGTEPKLKLYFAVYEDSDAESTAKLQQLKDEVMALLDT